MKISKTNGNGPATRIVEPPPLVQVPSRSQEAVTIRAPDIRTLEVEIVGTAPLMINRFSAKAIEEMSAKQAAGTQSNKGKARAAKDFDAVFENARHRSEEGWDGFAAGGLRAALISACRLVGFKMTLAKLSVFVEADGFDKIDGTPLIRILGGEPERNIMHARNATGVVDIRHRPMWRDWRMLPRIRFDADQFTPTDVVNLLQRVGMQVGLGEGRPDSRQSTGLGLGTFRVVEHKEGRH